MGYQDKTKEPLTGELVELRKQVVELKALDIPYRQLQRELNERNKELRCLYAITSIADRPGITPDELFQEIVNILPSAWQYPDITCAKIVVNNKEFKTGNYKRTKWKQSSDIEVSGKQLGLVEISYFEDKIEIDEGPFLKQERFLINAVAEHSSRIIERLQIMELFRSSKERYRAIFEQTADSIALVDTETGALIEFNTATHKNLGYSREEFKKLKIPDFEAAESAEKVSEHLKQILKKGCDIFETKHRTKSGEIRDIHVNTKVIQIGGKNFALTISRDISERKQAEKELNEYRIHLEQLIESRTARLIETNLKLKGAVAKRQQAEQKTKQLYQSEKILREQLEEQIRRRADFTRGIIHELKTPLTPMLGASKMLVDRVKDESLKRIAKNISRGAQNLNNRVNDLMDLARGELGMLEFRYRAVDVSSLLHELVDFLTPSAIRKEQSLNLELPDSLPPVRMDEDRIRQVILNLLNNSLKFTKAGGIIVLRACITDGNLVIEVEDNGYGIATKDEQRLFEPYFASKRKGERRDGLGLGLPLAKLLIDGHGGQIRLESKKGRGTVFRFSIPIKATQ
jgi:PAS domain S-box-containing protein